MAEQTMLSVPLSFRIQISLRLFIVELYLHTALRNYRDTIRFKLSPNELYCCTKKILHTIISKVNSPYN